MRGIAADVKDQTAAEVAMASTREAKAYSQMKVTAHKTGWLKIVGPLAGAFILLATVFLSADQGTATSASDPTITIFPVRL